ncbi:hypothetical protein EG856_02690 [Mycoplasmopsis phocirhinis]|uniref:Restriction endonuclease n=1 Tax=Mycoplasmopsis phocirhinis TaxID=142650 RepID=A0A4P6MTU3_9BACT|nr:hypothetical protein [Mycoplasmopsis phocirhinis]QBF34807.1 hypothetical protein EG856_02690 [Mycoplasmopsis phocirhinis]
MINWKDLKEIKLFLNKELNNIFKIYGYEIEIKAEDLNLLKSRNSCLRSSTAIGYILEEFIYQKFKNIFKNEKDVNIFRSSYSTQKSSYDFLITKKDYDLLINVKSDKGIGGGKNKAIAAINQLYKDYSNQMNFEKDFYYIVLKISYQLDQVKNDFNDKQIVYFEKIKICGFNVFSLEEISFANGHKQDNRNWSREFNPSSGRLLISDTFYKRNKIAENEKISNNQTMLYIEEMISQK